MIFVECKPDYSLIRKLTKVPKKIEHSSGKSAVLNKLVRRNNFPNYENSFGIIDEDPRSYQPRIIRKFEEKENNTRCGIKILHYRLLNNYVLVLCPRLEEWIIDAARECGIIMADYSLPNEPEALHQIINLDIDNFELLVDALTEKSTKVQELMRQIEFLQVRNRRVT